jgi:hypothetical protein
VGPKVREQADSHCRGRRHRVHAGCDHWLTAADGRPPSPTPYREASHRRGQQADNPERRQAALEFYELGMGPVNFFAAVQGRGPAGCHHCFLCAGRTGARG